MVGFQVQELPDASATQQPLYMALIIFLGIVLLAIIGMALWTVVDTGDRTLDLGSSASPPVSLAASSALSSRKARSQSFSSRTMTATT
jgi:hypothetical protein